MTGQISFQTIQTVAASWGLAVVGVSPGHAIEAEKQRLLSWQQTGAAADMAYMQREADLFVTPGRVMPDVKSVISFALHYDSGSPKEQCASGSGRVARYARGRDYHKVLKRLIQKCVSELAELEPQLQWRAFTDAVPILERAFARASGLGFIGKNTMLIRPGEGSFFFLGEALVDADVHGVPAQVSRGSCGSCSRCLTACPTAAFTSPYHLDARRCISYLTIEKRGLFEDWERTAIGNWVFGCDICQEVCPFNHTVQKVEARNILTEFQPASYIVDGCLQLESLLAIRNDDAFVQMFAGTPLMRAKRTGLLRNACCVAANTEALGLIPVLVEMVEVETVAELRAMAVYALSHLRESCDTGDAQRIDRALRIAKTDSDEGVRNEVRFV